MGPIPIRHPEDAMKLRHVFLAGIDLVLAYGLVYALGPYANEWGDAVLHILAGAFLMIFWFWFKDRFPAVAPKKVSLFLLAIVAVLLGALAWEGFEVILRDVSPVVASALGFNSPENDSISDVLFTLLGGAAVTLFSVRRW